MMKGRQKELNSLKEMGAMTAVKRSEAVSKRVIQTRWVAREKDGPVRSRLILKDFNRRQWRPSRRCSHQLHRHCLQKQCWLHVRMIEIIIQNATTSHFQSTYTQHSCTLMLMKSCVRSHQNPDERYESELREDEVWKLNKANGCRKAPKLWHQHVVSLVESLNYHPLLTDPSCLRHDELNINIFIHVDDGLLCGPRVEVCN